MNVNPHFAWSRNARYVRGYVMLLSVMLGIVAVVSGCKKQTPAAGGDSDANGYLCGGCGAKYYTDRTKTIAPKCPKCNQGALQLMGGYVCDKDQHMTIRPQRGDRYNTPVCEKCSAPFTRAMMFPRAKDFEAWGATKL
jgi:hypothetical protein